MKLELSLLAVLVLVVSACSGSCPQPQGSCTSTTCTSGSQHFQGDTAWKTDVPKELADSSASATVTAIMGFAAAPTSADTAEITSTGGTIVNNGIVLSGANTVLVTYPADKLIALAQTYTGADITSVTIPTGVTQNGGAAPSGCGVLGT